MSKKRVRNILIGCALILIAMIAGIIATYDPEKHETVKAMMKDAVLHDENKINFFGIANVDPSLISGYIVTAFLLLVALLIRIFAIPKFKDVPGKFQMVLECWVGAFDGLAKTTLLVSLVRYLVNILVNLALALMIDVTLFNRS